MEKTAAHNRAFSVRLEPDVALALEAERERLRALNGLPVSYNRALNRVLRTALNIEA